MERDIFNRLHHSRSGEEVGAKMLYLEQLLCHSCPYISIDSTIAPAGWLKIPVFPKFYGALQACPHSLTGSELGADLASPQESNLRV
jgi:hypothetical protein